MRRCVEGLWDANRNGELSKCVKTVWAKLTTSLEIFIVASITVLEMCATIDFDGASPVITGSILCGRSF